jgi:uncharacterized membrane protein SirB2
MGWKFSLSGLSLLAVFKFAVFAYENSPLVPLLVLLAIAILVAFFVGGTGKDKK